MDDVVEEFPTKSHADTIEFYYNWKFHEPDYSRWQFMKRQIDIALVSQAQGFELVWPLLTGCLKPPAVA